MTTLWQKWTKPKTNPLPDLFNPLNARLSDTVELDLIGLKGKSFTIQAIREVIRKIDGQAYKEADYQCVGDNFIVRIKSNEGRTLLLKPYDPPTGCDWMPYNEGLHETLKGSNKLEVTDKDGNVEDYWRIGTSENSPTRVSVIATVTIEEAAGRTIITTERWDFARLTDDEMEGRNAVRAEVNQFLFVEMNQDTGEFQLWQGQEIDADRVSIL